MNSDAKTCLLNLDIANKNKEKNMAASLPVGIITWLWGQYSRAKAYQTDQGITFNLTFLEYQALWKKDQLEKLIYWHKHNRLVSAMKHRDRGFVLSWRSKADRKAGVMDKTTARILTREKSRQRFYLQPGETHSEDAKKRIGDAQRGRKRSAEHKAAISRARKGTKQSQEHIDARVAATKATKQRKLGLVLTP